jgi:hypothetical protein
LRARSRALRGAFNRPVEEVREVRSVALRSSSASTGIVIGRRGFCGHAFADPANYPFDPFASFAIGQLSTAASDETADVGQLTFVVASIAAGLTRILRILRHATLLPAPLRGLCHLSEINT